MEAGVLYDTTDFLCDQTQSNTQAGIADTNSHDTRCFVLKLNVVRKGK